MFHCSQYLFRKAYRRLCFWILYFSSYILPGPLAPSSHEMRYNPFLCQYTQKYQKKRWWKGWSIKNDKYDWEWYDDSSMRPPIRKKIPQGRPLTRAQCQPSKWNMKSIIIFKVTFYIKKIVLNETYSYVSSIKVTLITIPNLYLMEQDPLSSRNRMMWWMPSWWIGEMGWWRGSPSM